MHDRTVTQEPESNTPTTLPRAAKLFAIACVPAIVALVYYAPSLASLGWHLLHGSAFQYHGLRVEVPTGWIVDLTALNDDIPGNPQGVTLQKPPKTLRLEARGPELMYINVLMADGRSTPQQQMAEWQSLFRESHRPTEFELKVLDQAPGNAQCLMAAPLNSKSGVALACMSIPQGWLANYAGSQQDLPIFLHVLADLRRQH